jgi:hypothetical protein
MIGCLSCLCVSFRRDLVCGLLGLLFCSGKMIGTEVDAATYSADTNGIVWGRETNGLAVGIGVYDQKHDSIHTQQIYVFIQTSMTNVGRRYLSPPECKLTRLELKRADGTVITNVFTKNLVGELPKTVLVKDLPRTPESPRHASMLRDWLLLGPNAPSTLTIFTAGDIFRLEKEEDCTLSVTAAVYQYSTNWVSVLRVDLPPVEAKLRIAPKNLPDLQ